MVINVFAGTGSGPTKLAAFDSALYKAGIANYNLLKLSSVIPANTKIRIKRNLELTEQPGKWGDRLYVVMSEARVDTPSKEAWAGIGWVQDKESGKGLFVEHEGSSEDKVRDDIKKSLKALMTTRKINFSPIKMEVIGIRCESKPVCAVVAAIYQASDWDNTAFYNE
jgi:arginine decarboxylase